MTDFTKGKVSDMPARRGNQSRGLAEALRGLTGDDAILMPAIDGEPLSQTQRRATATGFKMGGPGKFSTRVDRERNGVWVFLRRNGGSA